MDALSVKGFYIGDVVGLSFRRRGSIFFFEGICIAIKNKKFISPETSFILRNILSDVGVELCLSYYYNRIFSFKLNSFKKKRFFYNKSKLYYVRNKLNRESRVF